METVALRQRFAGRFVELARRAARDGEPMLRNLEYAYPGQGFAEIKDEFLMGGELLVAPVVRKGARTRDVVLPPGRWKADDGRVTRSVRVEVIYDKDMFPEGLVNSLYTVRELNLYR